MFGQYSARTNANGGRRYNNEMVAHVWASGSSEAGQSGNGNFYFNSRRLYSYGSHFVVGYRFSDSVVALNNASYSVSTGRHQSEARSATRHMTQIRMPLSESVCDLLDSIAKDGRKVSIDIRKCLESWILADSGHDFPNMVTLLSLYMPVTKATRRANSLIRQRERAIVRVKRCEKARLLRAASRYANDPREVESNLRACTEHDLRPIVKYIRQLHRAASAAGRTRQKKILWRLYGLGRELIKNAERRSALRGQRFHLRRSVKGIRTSLRKIESILAGGGVVWSGTFRDLANYARVVRTSGRAHRALESLDRLELEASERARSLDSFELALAHERLARERAAREEREREERARWFSGDAYVRWRGSDAAGHAYIRAVGVERDESGSIIGGELETSQGATVPLPHAVRAFCVIRRIRDAGRTWTRNGSTIRVGHFQIDRINADGSFVAGCHSFSWPEAERLARELGVFEMESRSLATD